MKLIWNKLALINFFETTNYTTLGIGQVSFFFLSFRAFIMLDHSKFPLKLFHRLDQ